MYINIFTIQEKNNTESLQNDSNIQNRDAKHFSYFMNTL